MNFKINEVAAMGNRDEDYFNSLSRKELQDLCRKNGLPSNKTKCHLAKLLASCYQKNNVSSRPLLEQSSSLMSDWPFTTPVLHLKHDSQSNPVGEQNKGVQEVRARAAEFDCQPPSISSKAVPVSTMNVVHRDPSINGAAGVYGCSRFDIQTTLCSLVGSQCGDSPPKLVNKDSLESPETREYKQNMTVYPRSTGSGLLPQSRCKSMNLPESHTDSSFISSNGTDPKLLPDFEFYVRSEEGINLFVDLNSSTSDWIKNLNNDVCICTEPMNNKPWDLHHELKSLEDGLEKDEKTSLLENTAVDFKNNGDHANKTGLTVRESIDVKDQPDAVDRSLKHIAEMQANTPVDTQMNTSLSEPISDVQKVMDICTKSSPQNSENFAQGLEVTLTSPVNPTGDHVMGSNSDGLKSLDSFEHGFESDKTCSENTEIGSVGIPSVSYISQLTLKNEILAAIKPISAIGGNGSRPFSGLSTTGRSIVMQLSEDGSLSEYMSNSPLQNGGAPDPDNGRHDLQYEIGISENSELDLNRGLDSLSECPEEQRTTTLTNETEISEFFQFDMLPKNCKRSHSSESEGLQNKRLHSHTEDGNNPALKDLRDAKDLAREAFPRRSMRLVSKV